MPTECAAHPALKSYFGYCLYKAAMRIRTLLDDSLKDYGVVAPQLGLLRLVLENDADLTQRELCGFMAIDRASMVKYLDGLEKKRFVKRASGSDDRRVKRVHITQKGKDFLKTVQKKRKAIEKEFLKDLTPEEQRSLREIIPKLLPTPPSD